MSGTIPGFASGQETELYGWGSGEVATAPTSQVLGNTWSSMWGDENPTARLFFAVRRDMNDRLAQRGRSGERFLTADEANKEYGIPGLLTFSAPLAESSARELRERAQARAAREDIAARANSGAMEWTARGALSLVAAALDPLNVASAFVPVVSSTRAAAWVNSGAGALGRIGMSARVGAIEGTAGALMLEPLMWGLASSELRTDYGMADSLLNVAFGAGFGALLHGAGRGIIDGFRGWTPEPRLAQEIHETAVRGAVAQIQRGDPVDVRPAFEAGRAATPESMTLYHGTRATFDTFDFDRTNGFGMHLSADRATAAEFANFEGAHGRIIERQAAFQQVLEIDRDLTDWNPLSVARWIDDAGLTAAKRDTAGAVGELEAAVLAATRTAPLGSDAAEAAGRRALAEWLDARGYDAIRYINEFEGKRAPAYIVWREPTTQGPAPDAATVSASVQRAAAPAVRPEDAAAATRAAEARARAEGGQRVETRLARTEAATATLTKEAADTDAVLAELVRAGRIAQAEADAVKAPDAAERVKQRVAGIEAGAACLMANGA